MAGESKSDKLSKVGGVYWGHYIGVPDPSMGSVPNHDVLSKTLWNTVRSLATLHADRIVQLFGDHSIG